MYFNVIFVLPFDDLTNIRLKISQKLYLKAHDEINTCKNNCDVKINK